MNMGLLGDIWARLPGEEQDLCVKTDLGPRFSRGRTVKPFQCLFRALRAMKRIDLRRLRLQLTEALLANGNSRDAGT